MTTPLLPPGRAIAALPPRSDALASIAGEVYRRRAVRRRRAYVVAIVLPLALVVTTLSLTGGGNHSLQPVTPPATPPRVPSATHAPAAVAGRAGGSIAGSVLAPGVGSSAALTSETSSAESEPQWKRSSPRRAGLQLLPLQRGFQNPGTEGLTCPRGIAHGGWCVTAKTDMATGTADALALALQVCRMDPQDGTLSWQTTREVEIEVRSGGAEVYRWGARRAFERYPHSEVLSVQGNVRREPVEQNPSMCLLWRLVWPVVDNDGRPLDRSADYTLYAWTFADGLSETVASTGFDATDGSEKS